VTGSGRCHRLCDARPLLTDNPPAQPPAKHATRTLTSGGAVQQVACRHRQVHRADPALADSYGHRFTVAEVGGEVASPAMKNGSPPESGVFIRLWVQLFLYASPFRRVIRRYSRPGRRRSHRMPSWAFQSRCPARLSRWVAPSERFVGAQLAMLLLALSRGNIFLYRARSSVCPGEPCVEIPVIPSDSQLAPDPGARRRPHTDSVGIQRPWGFSSTRPCAATCGDISRSRLTCRSGPLRNSPVTRRLIALRSAALLRTG